MATPKPVESQYQEAGLYPLVILPTGTGRVKAYVRGTFTSVTFGYVEADATDAPKTFVPFSSLTPIAAPGEEFLEPGPSVQVYASIVAPTGDGVFIGLSAGY